MPRSGQPANYGILRRSPQGLFSVRGLPPQLHLDGIYLNGLHELLPFWITNECGQRLVLDLASTADGALKVQRQNANWSAVGSAEREAYVTLADPAQTPAGSVPGEVRMVCSTRVQRAFSEVFNQLCGTSRIELAAGETAELVLVFVTGVATDGARTPELDACPPGHDAVRFGYVSWSAGITISTEADPAGAKAGRAGPDAYSASLRASLCRSVLEMDPPTSRIYLDDCVSGRLYERVLWVRNASAIELDWTITVVETTDSSSLSSLLLLDGDMQPLHGGHLEGGAGAQVVVRYTPHAAGEFLCRFLIENSNDPANMLHWVFRARASPLQKPKRVELLSDPDMSFGNCTSGVWYSRDAVFKNVSETPVVMRLWLEGNTGGLTMRSAVKIKQDDPGDQPADAAVLATGRPPDDAHAALSRRHSLAAADGDSSAGLATSEAHEDAASEGGSAEYSPTNSLPAARMEARQSGGGSASKAEVSEPGAAPGAVAQEGAPPGGARSMPDASVAGVDRRFPPRARPAQAHSGHRSALFDEVLIKPGAVRSVTLELMGNPVSGATVSAGQFGRQSFTLFCECSTATGGKKPERLPKGAEHAERNIERLSIPCTVNMCTPFVRVTPNLLDFGNVDVGTLQTMHLLVENLSQVEASIQCALESKVINCTRAPMSIPPMQSVSIRVDIYPRRVNARYRKQIIVRNKHNRLNDSIVEVRSTHVDQRCMAFHNVFYKTLVPHNEQNFVDFGTVPLNSQALRKINLRNICRCPIDIEISASAGADVATGDDSSDDSSMIAVYTIVPLAHNGAVTEEARRVARQLPLLERQAAMHSNIERFKEYTGGAVTVTTDVAAAAADSAPAVLQPGVFVDKCMERGHVCLVPFPLAQRSASQTASVDYLDIASTAVAKKWAVRVRAQGVTRPGRLQSRASGDSEDCVRPAVLAEPSVLPRASQPGHVVESASAMAGVLGRAGQILDEIVDQLDMIPQALFVSPQEENEYVRRQVDLRKYLDLLVESGFLRPARRIAIPALDDTPVLVILRPTGTPGPADKTLSLRLDANLYFRLAGLPGDMLPFTDNPQHAAFSSADQLPMRRFLIQASLCDSELEIGQKSINVGNMQVDEASRKYLVVQNRSETPLMYAIRKTGSIASGDIRFVDDNRYGVVRGFDSRKIVFVFTPSLTGVYNEQISIANVLNACGGKKAMLKAVVRRPSKFYIQSLLLEFGISTAHNPDGSTQPARIPLVVGQQGVSAQLLVIKNMTPKMRHVLVKPLEDMQAEPLPALLDQAHLRQTAAPARSGDPDPSARQPESLAGVQSEESGIVLDLLFPADVAVSALPKVLDRDTEEKIESLEQKLKIATRKDRPEKIAKYRAKLAKLRGAAHDPDGAAPPVAALAPELATSSPSAPPPPGLGSVERDAPLPVPMAPAPAAAQVRRMADATQLSIAIPANGDVSIPVAVVPRIADRSVVARLLGTQRQLVAGDVRQTLVVHEDKDKDNVKLVTLVASVLVVPEDVALDPQ
ncbi:hypothetical protein LPJ61_002238 [Coemansia biformis]|uniref:Uncharacterized protein n=1 Tax=Coemansia biformis TaxID=1286918 RepID=A0A9W7YG68_9FUNG|nr:hypothetical protein LPJ61_002238 [Coemansia biformis]